MSMISLPFNVTIATQETIDLYIRQGILYEDETGLHVSDNYSCNLSGNDN